MDGMVKLHEDVVNGEADGTEVLERLGADVG